MKEKNKLSKKKLVGIVLTTLYIVLMLAALFTLGTGVVPSILIIAGCILSIIYMLTLRHVNSKHLIIAGMICISVAAIVIGIQESSTQISHHIVRNIYASLIIWLFLS